MGKRIDVHNSSYVGTADMAFADSYWDGEQLSWDEKSEVNTQASTDLLRNFPLDSFRAEFMGRNYGIPSELLEYDPSKLNAMMGISMLHDVLVRPTNEIELTYISPIWKAMSEFGVNAAQWHPYWESQQFVTETPAQVKLSFYSRADKKGIRFLLIATNFSKDSVDANIHFAYGATHLIRVAVDALTHEPLSTTQHTITIPLAGSQWRMIEVH
jgi:hypothetical protein